MAVERIFEEAYGKYGTEVTPGTGVAVPTSIGFIKSGRAIGRNELDHHVGMGGQEAIRPGVIGAEASVEVEAQDVTMALKFIRSAYPVATLDSLTFHVADADFGIKLLGAKPNKLKVKGEQKAALKLTYDMMAMSYAQASLASGASIATAILAFFEAIVTVGGVAMKCHNFEIDLDNACQPIFHEDDKGAALKRASDHIKEGKELVTAKFDLLLPYTTDITISAPLTNIAAVAVYTSTAGGATARFTLANLAVKETEMPLGAGSDLVVYPLTFDALSGSLVIAAA